MLIQVVAVGKIKESYLRQGIDEYKKRISKYAKVKIVEVSEEDIKQRPASEVKTREAGKLLKHLPEKSDTRFTMVLDREGEELSSEDLAEKINGLMVKGKSDITFVIGGALGLDESVIKKADYRLSLSRLTFTHQIARFILLEQVYRSFKIIRGEPYHY